jgi:hypothetical protein
LGRHSSEGKQKARADKVLFHFSGSSTWPPMQSDNADKWIRSQLKDIQYKELISCNIR